MNYTENRPGGTTDSWCGKCKLVLAHTIEAMVGNKPARVHCNTCKTQHTYRPHAPGTSRPVRARTNRYQALLQGKDPAEARKYSSKDRYEPGDIVDHPTFGRGVTTAIKDATKIEVLFEGGSKLLVHGR